MGGVRWRVSSSLGVWGVAGCESAANQGGNLE
jgi:hypothetical protein